MHNDNRPRVLLAAGGTGGHLFPAYALAEELRRRNYHVDLATDMRGDRYGTGFPARKIHRIPSATLASKSPIAIAQTIWTLLRGIGTAVRVLREIRPSVVVGFGGYPTFPPLMAAKLRGIKTALHEQNAVLGRANRMLAARVDAVATSFNRVEYLDGALTEKAWFTGNPDKFNDVPDRNDLRYAGTPGLFYRDPHTDNHKKDHDYINNNACFHRCVFCKNW